MTMYQEINLYQPIFRKQRQIFSATTLGFGRLRNSRMRWSRRSTFGQGRRI
jgi:hypothetical protein